MGFEVYGYWPNVNVDKSFEVVQGYAADLRFADGAKKSVGYVYRTQGMHWVYQTTGHTAITYTTGAWSDDLSALPGHIHSLAEKMESQNMPIEVNSWDLGPGAVLMLSPCI